MNILGLVQLCDAAQPVGGYGETFAMEQLLGSGRIRRAEELVPVVEGMLATTIAPADGVASGIAYRAARFGAFDQLPQVCAAMSSTHTPLEMRRASVQMGVRLWALSRAWGWTASVHEQMDGFARATELHHAVAFGALVSETTSSQVRAIATYLLNVAKNIVMAAVRIIPLNEMDAQRVISKVQPRIAELAARYADKELGDIGLLTKFE